MKPQHARPTFSRLAYGNSQPCRLTGGAEHQAELISIGGRQVRLRLRVAAQSLLCLGERCLLHLGVDLDGQPIGPIPCAVDWMNGREAGLGFSTRVEISILALQQFIALGQQARKEAA